MRYSYWKNLPKLFKSLRLTVNFTLSIKDNKVSLRTWLTTRSSEASYTPTYVLVTIIDSYTVASVETRRWGTRYHHWWCNWMRNSKQLSSGDHRGWDFISFIRVCRPWTSAIFNSERALNTYHAAASAVDRSTISQHLSKWLNLFNFMTIIWVMHSKEYNHAWFWFNNSWNRR